jgi:glyoxylase-like metal-dependent hydrolase (beta-lactamase superfamily II)
MKRFLLALALLLGAAVVIAIAGLTWAHVAIRRERAPLPAPEAVAAAAVSQSGGPRRLSIINTASQPMPRSAVLDPGRDPRPDQPYVVSHPSFVLQWPDGRILLIDLGMNRDQALAFGKPLELLGGAEPIEPHGSIAEQLGDVRPKVQGVIFTHLHSDHVGGIVDLCAGGPVSVFMTPAQAENSNYTTRPGRNLLREAACAREVVLPGGPIIPVPGFPGVFVIAAGGHTPGSQIVVARVDGTGEARTYLFAGDIANNIDGIGEDIPKPRLYSLLMVPEDGERLTELRRFIRDLRSRHGIVPLVSHDERHLAQSGVPAWTEQAAGG